MDTLTLLLLPACIVCGVLNYGLTLYFFQYNFKVIAEKNYAEDVFFSTITSVFAGPICLIVLILVFLMEGKKRNIGLLFSKPTQMHEDMRKEK